MSIARVSQDLPSPSPVPPDQLHRLSVHQYHEMVRAGIVTDDDPVELIEGWLVRKMPKSPPHAAATKLTQAALTVVIPAGWHVASQEPITTADSEPEPDIVVIRGNPRDYARRHPGPGDIAQVVEISDSTIDRDRGPKRRAYARAGVAKLWIVNLEQRHVEACSNPLTDWPEPAYAQIEIFKDGDRIAIAFPDGPTAEIAVADLLP